MHPLITYLDQYLPLKSAEKAYLREYVPFVQFDKNTVLLKEGAISTAFYFVITGCIRMYYLVDGVEKTTFFYQENDFVSSYESFTNGVPAGHYLQALEPTQVAQFDVTVVADILERHPRFEILARIAMEKELAVYQEMVAAFVTLNAEQRYLKLMNDDPRLLQRIPQYHLATYLGVSPETLSRIRSRINQKPTS